MRENSISNVGLIKKINILYKRTLFLHSSTNVVTEERALNKIIVSIFFLALLLSNYHKDTMPNASTQSSAVIITLSQN